MIDIPVEFSAIAPIIVGVPGGVTPLTPRKAPHVLSWTVASPAREGSAEP
jgi:hypothetical protein